ncbi:MAG: SDR family NAD(P)-dependent oxidoreductase [Solirubrobacterales bacterium]
MSSLDPRKLAGKLMNLPTGVAESHLPLWAASQLGRLGRDPLERAIGGRTILITGASSGIGAATAIELGKAGAEVVLVARDADALADVASRVTEHGGSARVHPTDLTDSTEIDRLVTEVTESRGGVDILVNNAGRSIRRSLKHSTDRPHDFERTIELNYLAAVRLVLGFLDGMRERGFGHVVNVSSASVQVRTPRFAAYTGSKAALDAFSECASAELAHEGIRFTTVSMPLVRTPMIAPTEMYSNFPSLSPEQAGERICQAIAHRPRQIGTPYGALVGAIRAIDPVVMERIRNRGYQLFPESGGSGSSSEEEEATR